MIYKICKIGYNEIIIHGVYIMTAKHKHANNYDLYDVQFKHRLKYGIIFIVTDFFPHLLLQNTVMENTFT